MASFDIQIAAGVDDVWHESTHFFRTDLILRSGKAGTSVLDASAFRFTGLDVIPSGSTFDTAILRLTSDSNISSADTQTIVFAQAVDNPSQITTDGEWHSAISVRTINDAPWSDMESWVTDVEYDSPPLVGIMQELLDNGYLDSGVVTLFWDDSGSGDNNIRRAYNYESSSIKSARLIGTYTLPPTPTGIGVGVLPTLTGIGTGETFALLAPFTATVGIRPFNNVTAGGIRPLMDASAGVRQFNDVIAAGIR